MSDISGQRIIGDPIADYWINEIYTQTNLTIKEILDKVEHIQKHGRDPLVRTNSYRIPLVFIAKDHDIRLTDGRDMNLSSNGCVTE